MGLFFKKPKTYEVRAPFSGDVIAIENLKDQTFSTKTLGDGLAIRPHDDGVVKAPIDGEICALMDTRHAYGIHTKGDFELLIHIGQDTVKMNGDGFTNSVKDGSKFVVGDELGTFDIAKIKKAGYEIDTPVILIENDHFVVTDKTNASHVNAGDLLYVVKEK